MQLREQRGANVDSQNDKRRRVTPDAKVHKDWKGFLRQVFFSTCGVGVANLSP